MTHETNEAEINKAEITRGIDGKRGTEGKYGKYIIREPLGTFADVHPELTGVQSFGIEGEKWDLGPCHIQMTAVHKPFVMLNKSHAHPDDEYLCFIAGNPMDLGDFGAEVELFLGEEGEKHIINSSTIIFIPKGLPHCPIIFTAVKKPIFLLTVVPAGGYLQT